MPFVKTTEADFARDVMANATPVLVKFSAAWCGPCKAMAPVIDSVAEGYADQIGFIAVDIDEAPGIGAAHGVRGVPTLLLFHNGAVVERAVGPQSRTQLSEIMEKALELKA